jgi:hypothetical protein
MIKIHAVVTIETLCLPGVPGSCHNLFMHAFFQ